MNRYEHFLKEGGRFLGNLDGLGAQKLQRRFTLKEKTQRLKFSNILLLVSTLQKMREEIGLFQWIGFIAVAESLAALEFKRETNNKDFSNFCEKYIDIENQKRIILSFTFSTDEGPIYCHVCSKKAEEYYKKTKNTKNLENIQKRGCSARKISCCGDYIKELENKDQIKRHLRRVCDHIYEMRNSTLHRGFPSFHEDLTTAYIPGSIINYNYITRGKKVIYYESTNQLNLGGKNNDIWKVLISAVSACLLADA